MKSGINNVDTTGRHGAIRSRKAQNAWYACSSLCDRFQPYIDLAYSIPLCERFLPFITKLYVDVYCHPIDQDDYIEGARRHARPEDDESENMDEDMEEVEGGEEHVHEEHLNEQVLYDVSSGPRNHGRFAIANGAVRVADVRAAAKERTVRPSNPVSLQSMAREMARLCRANERLHPVAFRGFLLDNIWCSLAKLSFFYQCRSMCMSNL